MPSIVTQIFSMLGFLLRALGFLLVGYGIGRFLLDTFPKVTWQVQVALVLGFFGLLIGLTDFSTPGSSGALALGAGAAFLMASMPKGMEDSEEKK
jgi:hypothetical protein